MVYSKQFFALQIDFARAVSALVGLLFDRALLDYTNFYIRFGLGRDCDRGHPVWRRCVDGLRHASNPCDWTYYFYLAQGEDSRPAESTACFSYAMPDAEHLRIHFRNAESTTTSPLSSQRGPRAA